MNNTMGHLGIKLLFVSALLAAGCKKKDPPATPTPPVNQEEVITTITLTFTDPELNESFILRSRDLDGDGGNPPVITADTLPTGRYFTVAITLLDESVSPARNMTSEVQAESTAHQFFFEITGDANLTLLNFDQDTNGMPLGLNFNAITGAPSTGELRVTLRHDPDKNAPGVADGNIENAGGDTDLEVELPLVID